MPSRDSDSVLDLSDSKESRLSVAIQKLNDDEIKFLIKDEGVNPFYCINGKFICASHKKYPDIMESILKLYVAGITICIVEEKYEEAIRRLVQVQEAPLREAIANQGWITKFGNKFQNLLHLTLAMGKVEALAVVKVLLSCGTDLKKVNELEEYKGSPLEIRMAITDALLAKNELMRQPALDTITTLRPKTKGKEASNKEVSATLEKAIKEYDLEKIANILKEGAWDINDYFISDNINALHLALISHPFDSDSHKRLPVIDFLLNSGANTEIVDYFGRTALEIALGMANAKGSLMLLKAGANILNVRIPGLEALAREAYDSYNGPEFDYGITNAWGDNPVINLSEIIQCVSIVKSYCTADDKTNILPSLDGIINYLIKDPILGTAENVKMMIEYRANSDNIVYRGELCIDYFGRTARQIAALAHSPVKISADKPDELAMTDLGLTSSTRPLASIAAISGAGTGELILPVHLEQVTEENIITAIRDENLAYINAALAVGWDVNAEFAIWATASSNPDDKAVMTPILYAALTNKEEVLEFLLEHGANPNAKIKSGGDGVDKGENAIHFAARRCNGQAIKKLLAASTEADTLTDCFRVRPLERIILSHANKRRFVNSIDNLLRLCESIMIGIKALVVDAKVKPIDDPDILEALQYFCEHIMAYPSLGNYENLKILVQAGLDPKVKILRKEEKGRYTRKTVGELLTELSPTYQGRMAIAKTGLVFFGIVAASCLLKGLSSSAKEI